MDEMHQNSDGHVLPKAVNRRAAADLDKLPNKHVAQLVLGARYSNQAYLIKYSVRILVTTRYYEWRM